MSSDRPSTSSGLFRAFKASVSKVRHQPKTEEIQHLPTTKWIATTPGQIQVLKHRGEFEEYDTHRISVAVTKALSAIDGSIHHISAVQRLIERAMRVLTIDQHINSYISKLSNIAGTLKLTATSNALSIFKSLNRISASIIFITTRNFSIQKNLSISA